MKKESSSSSRKTSKKSSSATERKNRLKHQQSGERAWWMSEDPSEVPEGIEVYPSGGASPQNVSQGQDSVPGSETVSLSVNRIRHIESGERAWWMDSNSNIPEGVQKISIENESNSNSDDLSGSYEKLEIYPGRSIVGGDGCTSVGRTGHQGHEGHTESEMGIEFTTSMSEDLPLGDRISPEGVIFISFFFILRLDINIDIYIF